ncbi:MAG: Ribosomal RNA large subunit methyltransferase I [Firmicutes bacterium ADurb.Bin354]|nr:MAG: Ribosomal RNA large subunit methyltransferase I [Firmicutes bacterium ADurb.Bin354]
MKSIVTIRKGEGRLIKSGAAWIFDNEIESVMGHFSNGDVVEVHDFDGYPLGLGFINMNSKIRIRILTRDINEEINETFFEKRIRTAWEYRKKTVDISSCRVIFGEADFLPGFVCDKYEDVLVIQSLALGIDRYKEQIVSILKKIMAEDGIIIRGVYERSDAKEREKEGLEKTKGFIGEEFDTNVRITENDVKYIVDVKDGQKTGFFLDQKYNRKAIWPVAKGVDVLDCFTHTGSFGLNAALAGAKSVLSVDASESALATAAGNAALNHVEDRVRYECADVFEFLPAQIAEGKRYGLVILDPPAFTKSRNSIKNAAKGYREINTLGMELVENGGFLATCSCSHFMSYELFTQAIADAARAAHVRLRQVEFRTQSPDHPILWSASESYYLKFYILQVIR